MAITIGDVVGNRVVEQGCILEHHPDLIAEVAEPDITDVVPIDPDRAVVDVPEPGQ